MKNKKQAKNVLLAKPWKSSQMKAHINVSITRDPHYRNNAHWTLLSSKDRQNFIKTFLSWYRQQISLLEIMPNARGRTMKPDLKEPGKKFTWILPVSLATGLKSNTLHPMHTQKAKGSPTSHNLSWSSPGWDDAGRLYCRGAQNGRSYMVS